ncbi:mediator of RNA polymerase II transcription subunit 8-like [Ptychodera flava]|uniref:mediator of RNA polymerase II transcription subunit 8-like n=1 Tax=Ptychodera flava TaxID=63121 RepID=UPI00396A30C7
MQNQEKALDFSLDAVLNRVQDLKNSISQFIMKLEMEHETLNWPSVLDSFALISSQINTLNKVLKSDKIPSLRNFILLPLVLAPERDEDLEKMTEGRVPAFNHEVVPNYLRTKPEPEIEEKEQQLVSSASQLTPEMVQQQITSLNKLSTNLIEMINSARDDWDIESTGSRAVMPTTASQADTNALVAAVSFGAGLKQHRPPQPQQVQPPQPAVPRPETVTGKAPSSIKANIKASVHPYSRQNPGARGMP